MYEDLAARWRLVESDSPSPYQSDRWLERKLQREWRSTGSSEAFFTSKCRATRVHVISLMPFKKPNSLYTFLWTFPVPNCIHIG